MEINDGVGISGNILTLKLERNFDRMVINDECMLCMYMGGALTKFDIPEGRNRVV